MDELESGVVHGEPKDMKPAIGVDVGATLAKLAIRDEAGALHFESLPAREIDRVGDRVADFNPIRVGLTGGGASSLSERFAGISALQNEFESWGKGARHLLDAENLLKESRNLLVSLGTGTSVLLMDGDATHRVGGTALGGGTVLGLSSALLGTTDFDEICALAARGDRTEVDLVVEDVYPAGENPLAGKATASAFAKLGSGIAGPGGKDPENLAAAIVGIVAENVGLICGGLSYASQVQEIVFAGSTLRDNPLVRNILSLVTTAMGRTPVFLPHAEFGGALGAVLLSDSNH